MNTTKNDAIILIGMPGAGKSTIGVLLAKELARPFIDTDLLIQERVGTTLQEYLDTNGYMALRKIEERVLLEKKFSHCIVATGGSVVYSDLGMHALGCQGIRVYLKISLETLLARVNNQADRGLACAPGTTLESLYAERFPLYEQYADITVELDGLNFDQTLNKIMELLPLNSLS